MPLPSFLQRFRSGAQAPVSQVQPLSPADVELARVRARRRMIGMAVLVGAGVIGFPWIFETQPRPLSQDVQVVSAVPAAKPVAPPVRVASGKVAVSEAPPPVPDSTPAVPPTVSRALDAERSASVNGAGQHAEPAGRATRVDDEDVIDEAPPRAVPLPRPVPPKPVETKPAPAAKPSVAKPVAQPATAARVADARKPPVPAKPAATKPDPKADKSDKAEAKPAAKPDDNTRYIVQVGAFGDTTSAHTARMKVERLGIKTYTQAVDTPGGKKIRVRVGPYASKADADKAMATLRKAGLNGALLTL